MQAAQHYNVLKRLRKQKRQALRVHVVDVVRKCSTQTPMVLTGTVFLVLNFVKGSFSRLLSKVPLDKYRQTSKGGDVQRACARRPQHDDEHFS